MRAALAGEAPDVGERQRRRCVVMRLGYLGPARHVQRGGGAPGHGRAASAELVPLRVDPRGRDRRRPRRASTARSCRSRTRSRAGSTRRSTRWRWDAPDTRDRRRGRPRRSATASSPARRSRSTRSRRSSRTRSRWRSARASCATSCPRAARARGRPRPPRRCARSARGGRAVGRARPARRRRALRLPRPARGASTTSPATRRASCGSAPPAARRSSPTARAPWKTSVVFAGAGDAQPGWLVRCLSEFAFRGVNLTQDRVAPAARAPRATTSSSSTWRAAPASRRWPTRSQALHAHCEEVRLLGTYPAA